MAAANNQFSGSRVDPPDFLTDDVLLVIFDLLDEDDLTRCATVCSRWQRLLSVGLTFKSIYRRKIQSSSIWQKCSAVVKSQKNSSHGIYRRIYLQVQSLYNNWETGDFEKALHCLDGDTYVLAEIKMGENYVIEHQHTPSANLRVLKRSTMNLLQEIQMHWHPRGMLNSFWVHGRIVAINNFHKLSFFDAESGHLLYEIVDSDGRAYLAICFGNRGLVVAASRGVGDIRVDIWRMDDPLNFVHLKQLPIFDDGVQIAIAMDEHYIAVSQQLLVKNGKRIETFYFIRTDTLEIERSLSVSGWGAQYEQGMLILLDSQGFRLVDVSTGTLIGASNMAGLDPSYISETSFKTNSTYLVAMQPHFDECRTKFAIYDLQALKDNKRDPSLAQFVVPLRYRSLQLDDTQIMCIQETLRSPTSSQMKILALDFMPKTIRS